MSHYLERYFFNSPPLQALLYHPHPRRGVEWWRVWCKLVWWVVHQRGLHSHRALGQNILRWCQQGWCGYPGLLLLVPLALSVRRLKRRVHVAAQPAAAGEEWCRSQSRGWLCPGRRSWGRPVEGEGCRWMHPGPPCLVREGRFITRCIKTMPCQQDDIIPTEAGCKSPWYLITSGTTTRNHFQKCFISIHVCSNLENYSDNTN